MTPENTPIEDDFDPSAIHRKAFQDYLRRAPEDGQKLYKISVSLFEQIKKMGLPTNKDCRDFIKEVLDYTVAEGKTREEKNLFHYLTHQDEYGEVASPEEQEKNKQMMQEIAEAHENGNIPDFLQAAFARKAVKDLKNGSQGLTSAALRELNTFFTNNHVKSYAEVITNAAAETLLNEPVMQDINDMLEHISSAALISARVRTWVSLVISLPAFKAPSSAIISSSSRSSGVLFLIIGCPSKRPCLSRPARAVLHSSLERILSRRTAYIDSSETYCKNYQAIRRTKQSYVKMWVDGDYLGKFWY